MASAPYPEHWEADVLLRDGSTMRVRPIRPSDAGALQDFHEGQSEESTYFRFFAPLRRLPERDLARLVAVDHVDRVALVAVVDEKIVAVGRYDRVAPDRAEVAFNVSDALQGRGLGSVLLEHLAAAARERGVLTFVADVLPGNARMIRVFTDAGYDVVQRYEDGVISLSFRIDTTHAPLEVLAGREQRTDAASMRALLDPDALLVVAGSQEAELAVDVAAHLRAPEGVPVRCVGDALAGVAGTHGLPWTATLAEVTRAGALAVVAGSRDEVTSWVPVLAGLGVRGVVVLSGGFEQDDDQRDLLRLVRRHGLRLVGPRSFGLLTASSAGAVSAMLWPRAPRPGGVALFCQSSAAAQSLLVLTERYRTGVRTVLSVGHRADVSGNDLLQYVADDDDVSAVGMYLESLGNARKFARVVRRVGARVPVVAVVGAAYRGGAGQERALVEEAMLAAGVLVVPSMRAMVEATTLLGVAPLPRGRRIAVLSGSVSLADLAAAQVRHVDPDPLVRVETVPADLVAAARALAQDDGWDAALVVHAPPLRERDPEVTAALAALADAGRPVVAVVHGLLGVTDELTSAAGACVPAYESVEDAVAALSAAFRYARWRGQDHGRLTTPDGLDVRAARTVVEDALAGVPEGTRAVLDDVACQAVLEAIGVRVLPRRVVRSTPAALVAARELGWPVALKTTDERYRHRTDLGGVKLDVAGPIDLVEAVRQLRARQGGETPLEVQTMAPLGVACLVRAWDDPVLGPVVSFGLAGDATELLGDAAYAVPPLRTGDVHRLVTTIRAAPRLLDPDSAVDLRALEDVVARIAVLVEAVPQLHRLALLPVLASTDGAVVLHAEIEVAAAVRPDGARRSLRA